MMKKILAITMGTLMSVSIVANANNASQKIQIKEPINQEQQIQIPNPFVTVKTLEEAEQLAGFKIKLPSKLVTDYTQDGISAIKDTLININFTKENNMVGVRKGKGTADVSGDYTIYQNEEKITANNIQTTIKGNNGTFNLAIWQNEGFAYSVHLASGISEAELIEILQGLQ